MLLGEFLSGRVAPVYRVERKSLMLFVKVGNKRKEQEGKEGVCSKSMVVTIICRCEEWPGCDVNRDKVDRGCIVSSGKPNRLKMSYFRTGAISLVNM